MSERSLAILFAVLTAFFWGVYGPALGNARSSAKPPEWSAFKPYLFIGVAYFVWACLGGAAAIAKFDKGNFSFSGIYYPAMKWGFLAGSLGAFGALTLTFAVMNAGRAGSGPGLVMPIVFGGAVTVTAITQYLMFKSKGAHFDPKMGVGMALIAVGIVLVAKFTPHGAHGAKPAAPPAAASAESAK